MTRWNTSFRMLALVSLGLVLTACMTGGTRPPLEVPTPEYNETHLTGAVSDFGALLRAYPMRRPYRFDAPVVLELVPVPNYSGEKGLPPDLSTVLTTVVSTVGFPIEAKPPLSFREREILAGYEGVTRPGPAPDLTLRGSVTEGEKRRTREFKFEMDLLFADRDEDGRPGRDAVDSGFSREKEDEVWTLALDLHLVESTGLVVEAVSHRVDVVRRGSSSSFGVFFRGSGLGVRSRKLIAQSKSQALRIAAQQSVMVLLGRYLRVPYWRALPGAEPDLELIEEYRRSLENGEAPEDFRLLLFAHGVEIALDSYTFSEAELRALATLKETFGFPAEAENIELALHLWQHVPFQPTSRLGALRRHLLAAGSRAPEQRATLSSDSLAGMISRLLPGEELVLPVYFDYDLSALSEPAKNRLDLLIAALETSGRRNDNWWIDLRGHSDERGQRRKNQELSEKRAQRVRAYLEQKHGVPSERIASAGFGADELVHEDARTEEEHGRNRRVEVLLVAGERPAETSTPAPSGPRAVESGAALFPPAQWPLPRGVALPERLSMATLESVREAYPVGKLSTSFGYYSVRLGPEVSELFSEVTFFFRSEADDPLVGWIGLECRDGVEPLLRSAVLERYPGAAEDAFYDSVASWENLDGYHLTIGLDQHCLKIKTATEEA